MQLGIGSLNTSVNINRKFRFLFSAEFSGRKVLQDHFCKVSKRPTLELVEKENADGSYIIEKQNWAPFTTNFYDVENSEVADFYKAIGEFYEFGADLFKEENLAEQLEKIKDKLWTGKMVMCDGCGIPLEEWNFSGMWPQAINFAELSHCSSETIDLEITWRFKECSYKSFVAPKLAENCCTPHS